MMPSGGTEATAPSAEALAAALIAIWQGNGTDNAISE